MWVTLFALAMAVSVWFSAANLAVQLNKDRAAFEGAIERQAQMPGTSYPELSSANAGSGDQAILQLD
jgi:hypothetical protein